ncbi:MAG: phycobilisome protein [Leptolyngbyaceae bacterium]|nr:phycobilisome protein [Leptolyngbyaceae bacterium]
MLSQLERLKSEIDGRYATDAELQFMVEYARSFNLRLHTYAKLQTVEAKIVQQVHAQLLKLDPALLKSGGEDVSAKWKRDTIRVLRYSAVALLLNDPDSLRDRLLFWMQTIMRAFGAQRSCDMTYRIMHEVVQQHLTATEASLFCPILELNRKLLGGS